MDKLGRAHQYDPGTENNPPLPSSHWIQLISAKAITECKLEDSAMVVIDPSIVGPLHSSHSRLPQLQGELYNCCTNESTSIGVDSQAPGRWAGVLCWG